MLAAFNFMSYSFFSFNPLNRINPLINIPLKCSSNDQKKNLLTTESNGIFPMDFEILQKI